MPRFPLLATFCWLAFAPGIQAAEPAAAGGAVIWNVDNLESIGGHKVTVLGDPKVIDTDAGKAVRFDGQDDGLYVDANPLAGLTALTAEVVFKPAAGGPKEQRFLHFQPDGSEDRVLFETRLPPGTDRWFLDTYLQTGEGKHTLFADQFLHPLDAWQVATIVIDGRTMRHYVNCKEELSATVNLKPLAAGKTSIGMRFNRVHWFQGAIRQIRITPRALKPEEFLK
jgi:hypothetical protein